MLKTFGGRPAADGPDDLALRLHEPLLMLRLLAYAADAMRVLGRLERHAEMSPSVHATLSTLCPDWRNPGSLDDPADLLAMGLVQAIQGLTDAMHPPPAPPSP